METRDLFVPKFYGFKWNRPKETLTKSLGCECFLQILLCCQRNCQKVEELSLAQIFLLDVKLIYDKHKFKNSSSHFILKIDSIPTLLYAPSQDNMKL